MTSWITQFHFASYSWRFRINMLKLKLFTVKLYLIHIIRLLSRSITICIFLHFMDTPHNIIFTILSQKHFFFLFLNLMYSIIAWRINFVTCLCGLPSTLLCIWSIWFFPHIWSHWSSLFKFSWVWTRACHVWYHIQGRTSPILICTLPFPICRSTRIAYRRYIILSWSSPSI